MFLLIVEKGEGRDKHQSTASPLPPTGDQTHNLRMCPDQKMKGQPFGVQDDTQPISHTGQGLGYL